MSENDVLLRLFEKLDKSGDGVISHQELCDGLQSSGVSPSTIEKIMEKLDANMDGYITLCEYKQAIQHYD
ncbi:Polcalcin Nic t 2 isoform 2 [Schistosoma japonicum]|uniref:Polcalcin Nic t 2 isoform 2 n=1 Tax=Schistosoma japonicum TaxID=6182 RepID=A0A4Z2DRA1_SCHJA|nr:16 kDa calcium-binding protein [Schistosoma japonicum]TNN18907.1 Polcalcin Nic t 2 isoform 2 [Schistosoma japonicum]